MLIRLLLTTLLIAGMASAQRGGGGGRGGMGNNMPMAGAARVNRLDLMGQVLNLTKDQKKDVKTIMDDGQKEAAPLRDQLAKCRAVVAAAIQAG